MFREISKVVCILSLCLFTTSLSAQYDGFTSTPSLLKTFRSLVFEPNIKTLEKFTKLCKPGSNLSFDSGNSYENLFFNGLLNLAIAEGNVLAIRALIKSVKCSDGASLEALLSDLGNEILIAAPSVLIAALVAEGMPKEVKYIAALENFEWFAVECREPECFKSRNAFYQKKIDALQKAKIPKEHEDCRQHLIGYAKGQLSEVPKTAK